MVSKNKPTKKAGAIGQIFTPSYIAQFMVKNILNILPSSDINPRALTVLEPSAGEGIFVKFLLENNLSNVIAYEMDNNLKNTLLELYPSVQFKFDNFLGSDPEEKFDIIIGNPPYLGQNYHADIFQEYVKKYPVCDNYFVGNMDLFYFFIHLGIEKLNPGGLLSYITTNYWITKSQKTGIKLLKPHILDDCYLLQYIDLSSLTVFEVARGQHNCIFVLQKKTEQEKNRKKNKKIQIYQILNNNKSQQIEDKSKKRIFDELLDNSTSQYVRKYDSALTNNDLNRSGNWNLAYPPKIKEIVDKIENYCKHNGHISRIQDYFIIRNGLILINDNIFILKEGKELKIESNNYYVKVSDNYLKLNEIEKKRLKRIFKSKSIKPYGYDTENSIGYILYFNKDEFNQEQSSNRNESIEQKYPTLSKYLKQFEIKLRKILINAKENPNDFYFPRRGSFIRRSGEDGKEILIDLEPSYDGKQKIFFKFISNKNIFGYAQEPYFATSDTYFLWPLPHAKIDYLFTLAYLNSKLVSFLFKAKNIDIKRSKTKLENGLPMPNLKNFKSKEKREIIDLIKALTSLLVNTLDDNLPKNIRDLCLSNLIPENFSYLINRIKLKTNNGLEKENNNMIQEIIDRLFFILFNLKKNEVNKLLKEYYFLPAN
ncbi:MAG: Eco57I restriction-modification methylase domain-containing protein [Promethearchaeota archaeon]|jgi:adenine-specific DNA-methyltransferase